MKKTLCLIFAFVLVAVLAGCASEKGNNTDAWDLIPMVMVDGTLYLDTGHESTLEMRSENYDGTITSEVSGSEYPSKDDQSNFGKGYVYQYGSMEGTIEICINDKWYIYATEEVRKEIQFPSENGVVEFHGTQFNKSDLSKETLEWLEWYNSLSPEEQLAISSVPADLYTYDTAGAVDEIAGE